MAKTIVFMHGAFMTPLCWEHWIPWFEARGYSCLAPAWPGRDRPVEALRAAHPDPELGRLALGAVVGRFAEAIDALQRKPILVGHSIGGLVAQILLSRGAAAAAVAIHSTPSGGVLPISRTYWRSNWSMIGPFVDAGAPKALTFEEYQQAFANSLPPESQRAAFERYIVPESRRVARDARGEAGRVDFVRPHSPLLMTAGLFDRVIPARLGFNSFSRYRQRGSITEFRAFDGRDHMVVVEPGWEEVADFVADWLEKLGE
ncbi:MAG: alpha/beta hydrolase [Alphaproteobacteria bacterium]|nr:alpha/beta hydrolase [Alphaproteobacteria bacterium]MBV8442013.1 alpha/beta hydrolase [Hyphomicrobiales bacterium]